MTTVTKKISSAVSDAILFTAAVAMAGLGFAVVGLLALFGLFAVGVALIAAPFVTKAQETDADVAA